MKVSITGSDTLVIMGRLLTDLADGDASAFTFPDDIATVAVGKDGNAIFSKNEAGRVAEAVIRVLRGSSDDKFLNSLMTQQQANFSGFTLLNGTYIKKVGDGKGVLTNDTYILDAGVFSKQPEAKTNVTGDTEQSVTIYTFRFASAARVLT